jgi:2,4-dienoyl-CoA reductase-like NADH-dependent reductase (Old Yellow Enzyme family)
MATLFERSSINGLELKNRLVRSATHEGLSDESGCPTPNLFKLYKRLARGGVGLIITGYAYVSRDGISPFYRMQAIDRDETIEKYRDLVDHVHQNGAKIAMQIAHCGRQTFEFVIGTQPIAPSAVADSGTGVIPKEMTEDDIERVIDDFAQGARRVKEAGFDAVQIHCAHGYLLSSFISPYTNRRTDQWGGTTENRMRIVHEIYRRCRVQVGDHYPMLVKYSCRDKMEGGLSVEEGITVGRMLAEMGFDCIEVSAGIFEDGGSTLFGDAPLGTIPPQAYNLHAARSLKSKIDIPVMLVGGISDPAIMHEIVGQGYADYISMGRALICDPNLPGKMENDDSKLVECCHCNLCTGYCSTLPLRCYYGKKLKDHEPILEHTLVLKHA